jgi:hypothetical protein
MQKFGSLQIYVPPNALGESVSIHAKPVEIDTAGLAQQMLSFTGIAYDIGPADVVIRQNKPLTLTINYSEADAPQDEHEPATLHRPSAVKQNEKRLAIYHRESGWQRVGGSIDTKRHAITTTIAKLDTIALFEESTPYRGGPGVNLITDVAAQPRVFSPNGRGFLDRVAISFYLDKPAEVTTKVYNLSGRLVRVLCENHSMNPGRNVVEWNGRDYYEAICASGLYVVTIEAEGSMATKQVVVLNEPNVRRNTTF